MEVTFERVSGESNCFVRVSTESMKTDGLLLIEKLTSISKYCLNPGYYLIGCNGPAVVNVHYLTYNQDHDLTASPYYKVLSLDQVESSWTTVPENHKTADFDKSKPITGELAYPLDYTNEKDTFECNKKGYLQYLAKLRDSMKCTSGNTR